MPAAGVLSNALLPGVNISGLMFGEGRCSVWVDSDDDVTLAQSKDREYIRHRFVEGCIVCATVVLMLTNGNHYSIH